MDEEGKFITNDVESKPIHRIRHIHALFALFAQIAELLQQEVHILVDDQLLVSKCASAKGVRERAALKRVLGWIAHTHNTRLFALVRLGLEKALLVLADMAVDVAVGGDVRKGQLIWADTNDIA